MKKILFPIIIVAFCLLPTIAFGDDGKCIEGDCLNGNGIYLYPNGEKYDGAFKNGEMNGDGTYTYPDGSEYIGEFADGVRNGQGTLKIVDGIKYEGQWADDLPNGQGVKTLEDGMQYSGEFKNGVMHGSGMLVMPDGSKLKIKWDNARPSPENLYRTTIPRETPKSPGREPLQSAEHMEVSPQNQIVEQAPPSQEPDQSALPPEQAAPQAVEVNAPSVKDMVQPGETNENQPLAEEKIISEAAAPAAKEDKDIVNDKEPTEAVSKSPLTEKEKITSEAAAPASKQDEPEPEGEYLKNPETVDKAEYASITAGSNIRAKASLKSDVLRTVPPGYPVIVLGKKPNWFLVEDYRGRKGWVYASLVADPATVIIKVFKGNLRSGPSLKDNVTFQLDHGTILTVLERKGEWLKVSDSKKLTGWLYRKVVWPAAEMNE